MNYKTIEPTISKTLDSELKPYPPRSPTLKNNARDEIWYHSQPIGPSFIRACSMLQQVQSFKKVPLDAFKSLEISVN